MQEAANEDDAIGSGLPTWPVQDLANEGLFFSHPRLRELQVTCFSCGNVLTANGGQTQTQTFVHLDSCCKSATPDPPATAPFLAVRCVLKTIVFCCLSQAC